MNADVYRELARRLDGFPAGAPQNPELLSILQALFTPEEAAAALHLGAKPQALGRLAEAAGRPTAELGRVYEGMAGKGLLYARKTAKETYYSLLPIFPGIFELQFMTGERTPAKTRLAELFHHYYTAGMSRVFSPGATRFARVIPVEREIPARMEILDFERVSHLMGDADEFALATCYCRHEKDLLGTACAAPKDVCLLFGPFARFCVDRGFARRATRADAASALERSEAAGLIHVSDNVVDRINFLCNCCGCCCAFLRQVTEIGRANVVAVSRYVARLDEDRCTECGVCAGLCQVKAVTADREGVRVDPGRCLGCGACVTNCPTGALKLEPRPEYTPPLADLGQLQARILAERGLA